jgi:hypothetical protein
MPAPLSRIDPALHASWLGDDEDDEKLVLRVDGWPCGGGILAGLARARVSSLVRVRVRVNKLNWAKPSDESQGSLARPREWQEREREREGEIP